jgi:hypothetical protein
MFHSRKSSSNNFITLESGLTLTQRVVGDSLDRHCRIPASFCVNRTKCRGAARQGALFLAGTKCAGAARGDDAPRGYGEPHRRWSHDGVVRAAHTTSFEPRRTSARLAISAIHAVRRRMPFTPTMEGISEFAARARQIS